MDVKNITTEEELREGYAEYWEREFGALQCASGMVDRTNGEQVWIAARRALMEDLTPFSV